MLNLTAFSLRFEQPALDRLRLFVYTAPGSSEALARYLRDYQPRLHSESSVMFDNPQKIAALLPKVTDEGDLIEVAQEYAYLWDGLSKGEEVSYELHRARVAAAESCRVLSMCQRGVD